METSEKKNCCEIARDLLPLYEDGALSPASENFLSSHLASCEGCRRYRALLRENEKAETPACGEERSADEKEYAAIARRYKKNRRLWIGAAVLLCTVSLGYSIYSGLKDEK